MVMTVICLLIDLIQFFIQVKGFGGKGGYSPFADLTLIVMASTFMFLDWFYLLYLTSLTFKFPNYVSSAFIKSMFGMFEAIHRKLGEHLQREK
jgi:hypothetical protein